MKEYVCNSEMFQVLGIMGIDGSPSCGVNLTYCGQWGGELSRNPNLSSMLQGIHPKKEKGVFMEVLEELLHKNELDIDMISLNDFEKLFL